jgi:hypothetical protein
MDRADDGLVTPLNRKEKPMIERLKSKTAIATVASLVAALGVGGVAVAQNN